MSHGPMVDVEVVVAGGGPVGLTAAMLLARAGVSVLVLEQDPGIADDLRASTFHPPTLDMLDEHGITAQLLAQGVPCPHWQIRMHPEGDKAQFDLSVLAKDTRHPYRLQCEQWKLSRALEAAVKGEQNCTIEFGAQVSGLQQHDDHVVIEARKADGQLLTVRCRFAIGADGARSAVRQGLGLPFEGETYPETTLLATTTFPFEQHLSGLSNVSYCWKRGGNFALLRVPGRWRVSIYPKLDVDLDAQLTDEAIQATMQEIVPNPAGYEVLEKRPYRVHQRIVPRYGEGRVWLAGDAAHLNSPTGGMGLNGGVHDAFELTTTLVGILQRGVSFDTLKLYERRRRTVAAEQIIAQADRNRSRMRETDPDKRREILKGLQEIIADPDKLYAYMLKTSMIEGLRQAAAMT